MFIYYANDTFNSQVNSKITFTSLNILVRMNGKRKTKERVKNACEMTIAGSRNAFFKLTG